MNILIYLLTAIGFLCIGIFFGRISVKFDGLFIVDDSYEETTRWILDVKIDPKRIPDKKEIRLKVRKMMEGDV